LRASQCGICSRFQLPEIMLGYQFEQKEVDMEGLGAPLQRLDLSGCHEFGTSGILSIPNMTKLRSINLSGAARVNDGALIHISMHCPRLEELFIANCSEVTDAGLESLAQGELGYSLHHLDVARCLRVSDSGLIALASLGVLKSLDAQGCFRVTDYSLKTIGAYCKSLQKLNLRGMSTLTDQGLMYLSSGCPRLNSLCLSSCTSLGDETLFALAGNCQHLAYLDLFCVHKITDEGLLRLADGCPSLVSLNVSWCFRITPDFLRACRKGDCWPGLKEFLVVGLDEQAAASTKEMFGGHSGKRNEKSELSPLFSARKPSISIDANDADDMNFAIEKKRLARKRSGSFQRQDSNQSLGSSHTGKKAVPGISIDLAGSPRTKLAALGRDIHSGEESMPRILLNDHSPISPDSDVSTLSPQKAPIMRTLQVEAVKAKPESSNLARAHRRFGDSSRDFEREKEFQVVNDL
jgi:hypothetical protein